MVLAVVTIGLEVLDQLRDPLQQQQQGTEEQHELDREVLHRPFGEGHLVGVAVTEPPDVADRLREETPAGGQQRQGEDEEEDRGDQVQRGLVERCRPLVEDIDPYMPALAQREGTRQQVLHAEHQGHRLVSPVGRRVEGVAQHHLVGEHEGRDQRPVGHVAPGKAGNAVDAAGHHIARRCVGLLARRDGSLGGIATAHLATPAEASIHQQHHDQRQSCQHRPVEPVRQNEINL